MKKVDVIICGAGPAGLACALELVKKGKTVIVFEKDSQVGGISKTVKFKNNYFDIGGHRFFTKSEKVNQLWKNTLGEDFLSRPRLSRIYYRNKFFDYPVRILNAIFGLGLFTSFGIVFSYIRAKISPFKKEDNFEQWVSNRFGRKLFQIFFKTYTEKLWGIPCDQIQAEWAVQRIKGLSLFSAIKNAFWKSRNKKIKTLIDEFNYPKFGPGMMYEKIESEICSLGGVVLKETKVVCIKHANRKIIGIVVTGKGGIEREFESENFISSMPITELVKQLKPSIKPDVLDAADNLHFRSFITVSVILNSDVSFRDNWIYVHSPEVKVGRVQNFKQWSPYMVSNKEWTNLGLEYFCSENDELWRMKDEDLIKLALSELEKIGLGKKKDFVDGFVHRAPKTYPVYDFNYKKNLSTIKDFIGNFGNLQLIGRGGMFKYNNMDHSILTGMLAAENVLGAKHDTWKVNADDDYQESG